MQPTTFVILLLLIFVVEAAVQPLSVLQHAHKEFILNVLMGSLCFGFADILAQRIEQIKSSAAGQQGNILLLVLNTELSSYWSTIDWKRCISASFLGAYFCSGLYPAFYELIDRIWVKPDLASLVQKSVFEAITVGIIANSLSMMVRGLVPCRGNEHHHTPSQVFAHMKEELPKVTVDDFALWFPYNLVAFTYIPIHIRPLTTALVETIWQTYMSLHSNNYS